MSCFEGRSSEEGPLEQWGTVAGCHKILIALTLFGYSESRCWSRWGHWLNVASVDYITSQEQCEHAWSIQISLPVTDVFFQLILQCNVYSLFGSGTCSFLKSLPRLIPCYRLQKDHTHICRWKSHWKFIATLKITLNILCCSENQPENFCVILKITLKI